LLGPLARPSRAQEDPAQPPPAVKLRSEKKAQTLSVVGTIIPWAVAGSYLLSGDPSDAQVNAAALGLLATPFGPSLGYFYARATGRALLGIGIRLVGMAGIVGGGWGLENADANDTIMKAFIAGGIAVTAASTILDLAGVKKTVRRHNLKVQKLQMALSPVVSPRAKAWGLRVQIGF
jgi:hypothetical protein